MDEREGHGQMQTQKGNIWKVEAKTISLEGIQSVLRASMDGVRKAKAQRKMNLASDIKDNKKGFSKYISDKRQTRENVCVLWKKTRRRLRFSMPFLPRFFFFFFFTKKCSSHTAKVTEGKGRLEEELPTIGECLHFGV